MKICTRSKCEHLQKFVLNKFVQYMFVQVFPGLKLSSNTTKEVQDIDFNRLVTNPQLSSTTPFVVKRKETFNSSRTTPLIQRIVLKQNLLKRKLPFISSRTTSLIQRNVLKQNLLKRKLPFISSRTTHD